MHILYCIQRQKRQVMSFPSYFFKNISEMSLFSVTMLLYYGDSRMRFTYFCYASYNFIFILVCSVWCRNLQMGDWVTGLIREWLEQHLFTVAGCNVCACGGIGDNSPVTRNMIATLNSQSERLVLGHGWNTAWLLLKSLLSSHCFDYR